MSKSILDKGDFLTFAAIGDALGLPYIEGGFRWRECELEPGVWRRHPNITPADSRSDISRDGYMGVIFNSLATNRRDMIHRIRRAGWKTLWTMGDRGNFDYINIWPLVPILYAEKWSWFPTIPTLCTPFNNSGYRAHLLALAILIERLMGKRRWSHKQGTAGLVKKNPKNLWFRALYSRIHDKPIDALDLAASGKFGEYHWGGCPPVLFAKLVKFTLGVK